MTAHPAGYSRAAGIALVVAAVAGAASQEVPALRVLVTGSRTWADALDVAEALQECQEWARALGRELVVVHGACPRGADAMAEAWAAGARVAQERHPADWSKGRGAGYARNAEMVALGADVCLAFIRDASRGATHCATAAARAGIPVRRWEA